MGIRAYLDLGMTIVGAIVFAVAVGIILRKEKS